MPKFLVPITRDTTETTMVDVEAATALEARDKALAEVIGEPWLFDFVPDDGAGADEPYFAGDDDLEAIEALTVTSGECSECGRSDLDVPDGECPVTDHCPSHFELKGLEAPSA